jgi:large subunit ribosomal protein L6
MIETNIGTKYIIKIPSNITVFYSNKNQIIVLKGPLGQKSLKLKVKIRILKEKNSILVSSSPFSKLSNSQKKKVKALQGTTVALIKKVVIEVSSTLYQKLKFVGVGYRVFDVENYENRLLLFRLGYSHSTYFKIPTELKIFCLKLTKLFICGNSHQHVTQTAALIRSKKTPEPYKGKGILYNNEKIVLKEGKKI